MYSYANGIQLAATSTLPIFGLSAITVNQEVTNSLSQHFGNIYARTGFDIGQDTYKGGTRFTGANETNNTIIEQFGATGGFYAYNPTRAFGDGVLQDTTLDAANAQYLACLFLINKGLNSPTADIVIPGTNVQCDHNFDTEPLYQVTTEYTVNQSAMAGVNAMPSDPVALRMIVTIPLMLRASNYGKGLPDVPLGGPGGHISMIFDDTTLVQKSPTTQASSTALDDNFPGLQAVAMPVYGRTPTYNQKMVTLLDPVEVQTALTNQIKAAYPDATKVNVPTPALNYFLSDAGTPLPVMEPNLTFSGITLEVDGQTMTLKSIDTPATPTGTEGLGPNITITSPVNGSTYFPAASFNLTGTPRPR